MIISPYLLTDPLFERLKTKVGDCAMECLIWLYAFCEADRRGGNLGRIDANYLERICKWKGQPGVLGAALLEPDCDRPGFVQIVDGYYHVVGWDKRNKKLLGAWSAREKGEAKKSKRLMQKVLEQSTDEAPTFNSNSDDIANSVQFIETDFRYIENAPRCHRVEESRVEESRVEESGGTSPTPPNACERRFPPSSVEEVISYGETCTPPVPRHRCLQFWAHYEGQAVTKSGKRLWMTSQGTIITNWKARLHGWALENGETEQKNTARESAAVSARLSSVERRLREIGDGNADTVVEKLRLQKERADLLLQQKGCVPNAKDK